MDHGTWQIYKVCRIRRSGMQTSWPLEARRSIVKFDDLHVSCASERAGMTITRVDPVVLHPDGRLHVLSWKVDK